MTTAVLELATTSPALLSTSTTMKALVYHGPSMRATTNKSTSAVPGKETVMKSATSRSSLLFPVVSVVVLTLACASAQAQTAPNDGAALYKAKCAMCHGPDGAGKTPVGQKLNVRDLRSPEVQKQSDSDLAEVIGKGKGKMPVFGKTLNEDQIKSLVAQIRELGKK